MRKLLLTSTTHATRHGQGCSSSFQSRKQAAWLLILVSGVITLLVRVYVCPLFLSTNICGRRVWSYGHTIKFASYFALPFTGTWSQFDFSQYPVGQLNQSTKPKLNLLRCFQDVINRCQSCVLEWQFWNLKSCLALTRCIVCGQFEKSIMTLSWVCWETKCGSF